MLTYHGLRGECAGRLVAVALFIAACFTCNIHAGDDPPAPPTTVYVFNGGANNQGGGDRFNHNAQGWIFENLGLLGPNGQYPTIGSPQNRDGLFGPDGQQVGSVLRDRDDNIIGYQSADGTRRAYNVDTSATVRDAWLAVAANGNFIIAKHGGTSRMAGQLVGVTSQLDGGRSYAGFREEGKEGGGTGAPGYDPYELPPRPGANIKVHLNACYSDLDADENNENKKSPSDSMREIPGVSEVDGNQGCTYKVRDMGWQTVPGVDVEDILEKCVPRRFRKNIDAWLDSLPPSNVYNRIIQCLKNGGVSQDQIAALHLTITFLKNPPDPDPDAEPAGYYEPPASFDETGGQIVYQQSIERPWIALDVPEGALEEWTTLFVTPIDTVGHGIEIPSGMTEATFVVQVRRYDRLPVTFHQPANLAMSLWPDDDVVELFQAVDGALAPYPAEIDYASGQLFTTIHSDGIWVALRPDVEPTECPGDINGDGVVDVSDLLSLLSQWGDCPVDCPADLNGDGVVDVSDLLIQLSNWGPCSG